MPSRAVLPSYFNPAVGSANELLVPDAAQSSQNTESASNSAATGNDASAGNVASRDPLGKYDPPIEVSIVRNVNDVVENNVLGVLKGETLEDNRWSRIYEEQLGIKLKYDWVVKGGDNSDQYVQKLNVTLASGELPDFIPVNAVQLKQLAESDH